jgi:CheY-like chemotaxis protein
MPDREHRTLKILVIEDESICRTMTQKILKGRGHDVVEAHDGKEALFNLQNEKFDIVFMDVKLPVMDGVEATRRIRNGEAGDPKVPICALTALAMPGDKEKCLAAGMDFYLSKPILFEELYSVLEIFEQPQRNPN